MDAKLEATNKQINDLRGTLNLILAGIATIIVSLLGFWTKPWWLKLFKRGSERDVYTYPNFQGMAESKSSDELVGDTQSDNNFTKR